MNRLRRFLARRKWCPRTDTNECWCRGDQPTDAAVQALAQSGRTIPITPEMRARAVGKMLSQRKAIVEGRAHFRVRSAESRNAGADIPGAAEDSARLAQQAHARSSRRR